MPCCRYVWSRRAGRLAGPGGLERGPVGTGQGRPSCSLPLQAILKRGLQPSCTIIPLMKKDHRDNLEFFLSNVGQLYLTGAPLSLLNLGGSSAARPQGGLEMVPRERASGCWATSTTPRHAPSHPVSAISGV